MGTPTLNQGGAGSTRVAILGSGLMGGKLGAIFARAGHEVVFSYARSEQKLKRLARDAKGKARAGHRVRRAGGHSWLGSRLQRTAYRSYKGCGMVKVVYCITKKTGLTDEQFFRYWREVHGPLGARIPRLRKLVQSRRLTVPGDQHQPDYDGMAELWFDDVEALLAARQSPEWKASTEDEANFIDHSKLAYSVSEEQVILETKENQLNYPHM